MENAIGTVATATGGIPSTAAVTAASQAGDYYAGQLADIVPELEQQAFAKYLNEYNLDLSALNALQNQDQLEYSKLLDQLNYNTNKEQYEDAIDYERAQTDKQYANDMAKMQIMTGDIPESWLLEAAGIDESWARAMAEW
jgi:hypothetical protein